MATTLRGHIDKATLRPATNRYGTAHVAHCHRCDDSGEIWVVCPDAGAVRLDCDCGKSAKTGSTFPMVETGIATAVLTCCGIVYLLF